MVLERTAFESVRRVMPIYKEEPMTYRVGSGGLASLAKAGKGTEDFSAFKRDVQDGVYTDWKYNTVDEAKKRAIYSAPTYDGFRQLVAGCTLKPISTIKRRISLL